MKRLLMLLAPVALFAACSSMNLPTAEESARRIASLRSVLSDAERPLHVLQQQYRTQRDLGMTLRLSAVNRISKALVQQRTDDLLITFLATRPLLEERKSVLGITYTNRLDIDSGRVLLDLRRFEFIESRRRGLEAVLALEGDGRLHVSGRYTGVPGSVSPKIQLSLRDTVRFTLTAGYNGAFVLTPVRDRIMLRAVFRINLLGWEVPWSEDIPLEVEKLLPVLTIPSFFDAAMKFPVPASDYSVKNYHFESVPMKLRESIIDVRDGKMMYRADVKLGS
jgi:hypothetical protein